MVPPIVLKGAALRPSLGALPSPSSTASEADRAGSGPDSKGSVGSSMTALGRRRHEGKTAEATKRRQRTRPRATRPVPRSLFSAWRGPARRAGVRSRRRSNGLQVVGDIAFWCHAACERVVPDTAHPTQSCACNYAVNHYGTHLVDHTVTPPASASRCRQSVAI